MECQGELGRPALVRKGHEWDWWPRGVFRGSATTLPPEAPQKWGSLGLHVSSHRTHGHPHLFWTVFQEWGSMWEGAELPGGSGARLQTLHLASSMSPSVATDFVPQLHRPCLWGRLPTKPHPAAGQALSSGPPAAAISFLDVLACFLDATSSATGWPLGSSVSPVLPFLGVASLDHPAFPSPHDSGCGAWTPLTPHPKLRGHRCASGWSGGRCPHWRVCVQSVPHRASAEGEGTAGRPSTGTRALPGFGPSEPAQLLLILLLYPKPCGQAVENPTG